MTACALAENSSKAAPRPDNNLFEVGFMFPSLKSISCDELSRGSHLARTKTPQSIAEHHRAIFGLLCLRTLSEGSMSSFPDACFAQSVYIAGKMPRVLDVEESFARIRAREFRLALQ
jgi:hypothetical protein